MGNLLAHIVSVYVELPIASLKLSIEPKKGKKPKDSPE